MIKKTLMRAGLVLFVVVATAFLGAVLAHPAGAAAPDCRTVTSHLIDRPDNGHGTPSMWALDTLDRKITVCHQEAPAVAKVAIETWTYTATLTDAGTFVTQAGAHGSPNAGVALAGGTKGAVNGHATYLKFTAPHDWGYWNGDAMDGKTFHGSAPSGTDGWIANLWTDGFSGTHIDSYSWTYKTCVEQWVDSSEEGNGDGTSDSAGDITGKACPSPSPSRTTQPTAPVTSSPVIGAPSLPVTGFPVGLAVTAGAVLVAAGGTALALSRRRRTKFEA